jgi:hypothetical protein
MSDQLAYRKSVLNKLTGDVNAKLAYWRELERRFCEFNRLFQANASMHEQTDAVSRIRTVAEWMKNLIAGDIYTAVYSVTNVRRVWDRGPDQSTEGQAQLLHCLKFCSEPEQLKTPMVICSNLQIIDMLIRQHPECKTMITERMLSLLADLSVLIECLRQVCL